MFYYTVYDYEVAITNYYYLPPKCIAQEELHLVNFSSSIMNTYFKMYQIILD